MKVTVKPIVIATLGIVTKHLVRGLGNERMSGDHPNDSIVEIGQNIKKSPGDLRLVVSQTPLENHQKS